MIDTATYNRTVVDQHTRQAAGYAALTGALASADRRLDITGG